MKKYYTSILFVFLLQIINIDFSYSFQDNIKFGKVPDSYVEMVNYKDDPEAEALVISNSGETAFIFNSNSGFIINYKYHKIVKVLEKDGVEYADIIIPFYSISGRTDRVFNIKGFTYNSENGKINKIKLGKENIFEEKVSSTYNLMKISMPDVRVGSVIEVSYEINSDLYNYMREWEFQEEIPTLWSEYKLETPEYFSYSQINQGSLNYKINQQTDKPGRINFVSNNKVDAGNATRGNITNEAVDFINKNYHWAIQNAPALRVEPFVDNPKSYGSRVEFQLQWVQFPNSPRQNIASSWEKLGEELLANEDFGRHLNRTKIAKNVVPSLIGNIEKDQEKVSLIMDHLSSKVVWNGKRSIYPSKALDKIWEDGNGNVADINLLLVAFLREAGFDAHPIISSTRDNGFMNPSNPVMYKLNYVTSAVKIDGKEIILDATDRGLPIGMSPLNAINFKGFVLSDKNSHWIDFTNSVNNTETAMMNISFENGKVKSEVNRRLVGYKGAQSRRNYIRNGEETFLEDLTSQLKDWSINNPTFENIDNRNLPYTEKYTLLGEVGMENTNTHIYFNPFEGNFLSENPFKLESRQFPIDFIYGSKFSLLCMIDIPEGYEIEEYPESSIAYFENKDIQYSYMSSTPQEGKIQIIVTYQVNQTFYNPEKYKELKNFYDLIVEKQKQMIVFKRIAE
ncbi:DUF3857 domain-containing protein [Belliella pelovolcani]|uniref:DUF3857 domain-containing protein n=1 Tax=Belliella pelovolcani TaxID=529505 RepID=A0A1N7P3A4_9BACT|nr:DUF3857 domain-containing protein [Belliella pelovolcani]SIT05071.1 protein of unknown function [Belliella pelovolcani]